MIEKIIIDYLKSYTLLNVPVFMEIPTNPPISFITIQKLDAGKMDKIRAATLNIEAYSDTKFHSAELSEKVITAMEELGESSSLVFSCKLGGERDNTNTANKKYCYETTWNIFY